jgi:hypothetical protein
VVASAYAARAVVAICIPNIPTEGPLLERGVRIPRERIADEGVGALVSVQGADGSRRRGAVTYVDDGGVEITYSD